MQQYRPPSRRCNLFAAFKEDVSLRYVLFSLVSGGFSAS
jgi:hypothetical protein